MSKQAAASLLKQYLEQRQVAGQSHVGLRPGVMDKLAGKAPKARQAITARVAERPAAAPARRAFAEQDDSRGSAADAAALFRQTMAAASGSGAGAAQAPSSAPTRQAAPPAAATTPAQRPQPLQYQPAPPAAEPPPAARTPVMASAPAPVSRPAAAAVSSAPNADGILQVPGNTKAEKLAALAEIASRSPEARALGTLRQTMVFAVGNPDTEIMFIGEAPGSEEERQQEPFVGPAGQKLTGIIKAMGLDRSQIYISNICKFRPAMENQGNSNRPPTTVEMRTCLPYILTEISIIRPKVLVALGKTAAEGLGISGPVSRLRGQFYPVQGLPTMVTYHPSYILREEKMADGGRAAKRQVWEDMMQVMEKVGLPISDKQRAYFKK